MTSSAEQEIASLELYPVLELHEEAPCYTLRALLFASEIPHVLVIANGAAAALPRGPPTSAGGGELPLPAIVHGGALAAGSRRAVAYARALRPPPGDEALSESQVADSAAWTSLVNGPLDDALLRSRLEDGFGAPGGGGRQGGAGWGLGVALRAAAALADASFDSPENRARAYICARGYGELSWAAREAAAAYTALGERYRNRGHDGPFFYGHAATTLDAIVFGHLASARTSPPCSRWARGYALPALAPFVAAFAAAYFADDEVLGSPLFRSLAVGPGAAGSGASDSAAGVGAVAAEAAASVAVDDVASVSALCRGVRGGSSSRFRARERRWLDALRAMAAAEEAAASGAAGVGAEAGAQPNAPPLFTVANFPMGFGELPGAIDFPHTRGGSGSGLSWLFGRGNGLAGRGEPPTSAATAAITLGILAAAGAIIVLTFRRAP